MQISSLHPTPFSPLSTQLKCLDLPERIQHARKYGKKENVTQSETTPPQKAFKDNEMRETATTWQPKRWPDFIQISNGLQWLDIPNYEGLGFWELHVGTVPQGTCSTMPDKLLHCTCILGRDCKKYHKTEKKTHWEIYQAMLKALTANHFLHPFIKNV